MAIPTSTAPAATPAATAPGAAPTRVRRTLVLYALTAVVFVAGALGLSRIVGGAEGTERLIVIPAGTADRLAAGEAVDIVPADLRFELRDQLVVINQDSVSHTVGSFTVGPGERLEKRFSDAATFSGICSLHASGSIRIEISGT